MAIKTTLTNLLFVVILLALQQSAYSQLVNIDDNNAEKIRERVSQHFQRSVFEEPYGLGKDSKKKAGVPEGTITKFHFISKKIYPGVKRDYWVYVPQHYNVSKAESLMVFQDGWSYLYGDDVKANIVLDNLIRAKEIPVIIAVFINPGDKGPDNPVWGGNDNPSIEYDTINNDYPKFLIEELIPEVSKKYNLTNDPEQRAICGMSSGGIVAFNAGWQRPDYFRTIISHCGSFTNIRGGHLYPDIVRRSAKKPLKVFLQSGENDADAIWGSWALANKEMDSALAYRGYKYTFVFGEGGHSLQHGGAIFPGTLRWIWRDDKK